MPDARQLREAAASAALAGAAVNPLSTEVVGPGPEGAPSGDVWEQEGFRFELIDSPEGQLIRMTPLGVEGAETITITDPEEIAFILSKREGGADAAGPEQIQEVAQEPEQIIE